MPRLPNGAMSLSAKSRRSIVYRDPRGTFTRSVTITFIVAVFIMFIVRGQYHSGGSLLRCGRLYANYGHGARREATHPEELHRPCP